MSLAPAGVAQLVAQTTCNRQVVGSIPTAGSIVMSRDIGDRWADTASCSTIPS